MTGLWIALGLGAAWAALGAWAEGYDYWDDYFNNGGW